MMLNKDETSVNNIEGAKKKLEEEYSQIIEEHRTLKRERTEIIKEAERLKIEKEKMEDTIIDMERKFKKVINDFELTNSLLTEEKQRNATMMSTVGKL